MMASETKTFIPQIQPTITQIEVDRVSAAVQSTWITESNETQMFEQWFSNVSNRPTTSYCNGTAALLSIGHILKMRFGTLNLAVPNMTFISSMSPFLMLDANITLLDVDQYSGQLDVSRLEEIPDGINVLVLPILYGAICDIDEVERYCRDKGICLVIDAAQAVGQSINGRSIFSFGDFCFSSFYGNKIITTGSGGMLMTNNKTYYKQAKYLSTQSKDNAVYFIHNNIGYNLRMNNISASLGLSQLNKIDYILSKKQDDYKLYQKLITNQNLELMQPTKNTISNNWLNIIKIKKKISFKKLKHLIKILHEQNVYVRPLWYPNHLQKFLKKYIRYNLQSINSIFTQIICLPSSPSLKNKTIIEISKIINKIKI